MIDSYSLNAANDGTHRLSAGSFFLDTTPLRQSIFRGRGGVAGQNPNFLTLAGQMDWNGFNLAVAWTGRDTDNGTNGDDFQLQFSAGYAFDFGLYVHIGWKFAEEAGIDTETLGVLAAYTFEF